MVAWARWSPSGILSAADEIFLIKDAIVCGSTACGGDLLVKVGQEEGLEGNETKRPD